MGRDEGVGKATLALLGVAVATAQGLQTGRSRETGRQARESLSFHCSCRVHQALCASYHDGK